MFDRRSGYEKKRNRKRFKELDKRIDAVTEYCMEHDIPVDSWERSYEMFRQLYPDAKVWDIAGYEPGRVLDDQSRNIYFERWKHRKVKMRQPNGNIVFIRRFLNFGNVGGWQDVTRIGVGEMSVEGVEMVRRGLLHAADVRIGQARALTEQAKVYQELAEAPQQPMLLPPDNFGGSDMDEGEGDDDGDYTA